MIGELFILPPSSSKLDPAAACVARSAHGVQHALDAMAVAKGCGGRKRVAIAGQRLLQRMAEVYCAVGEWAAVPDLIRDDHAVIGRHVLELAAALGDQHAAFLEAYRAMFEVGRHAVRLAGGGNDAHGDRAEAAVGKP